MVKANSKHISQNPAEVITCQLPPIPVRAYLHMCHQRTLIFPLAAHSLKYPRPSHILLHQSRSTTWTTKCLIIPWIFFSSFPYLASLNELRVHSEIQTLFWGNVRDSASQPPHFLWEQVERWTDAERSCVRRIMWRLAGRFLVVITEPPLCRLSNMICEQWDRKLCYQSWRGASGGVWHFIFSLPSQWQSSRNSSSV